MENGELLGGQKSMRMNKLGRTGVFVSELCLGTMTFGGSGDLWTTVGALKQSDADGIVGRAIEAGINFIDTANVYGEGQSEQITGQALRNLKIPRDDVVIATKGGATMGPGPNADGASRLHIIGALKASLKRLQVDHVDLYQIHGFDPATPIEETVRALDALVQYGYVRYVGVSNWAAWQIVKALGIAERHGLARFESLQSYYTLAGRDIEREIIPMLKSENLGLMVWSPLAGGLLSGKVTREQAAAPGTRRAAAPFPPVDQDRAFACIDAMKLMAETRGISVAQIALSWLLHQKAVSSVIIGAKRLDQLEDNLAATEVELTDQELDVLDQVSALPKEYPGWAFEFVAAMRSHSPRYDGAEIHP
jgi:aryl-alcohol dehydrogenase-like predicted oxidoreductase